MHLKSWLNNVLVKVELCGAVSEKTTLASPLQDPRSEADIHTWPLLLSSPPSDVKQQHRVASHRLLSNSHDRSHTPERETSEQLSIIEVLTVGGRRFGIAQRAGPATRAIALSVAAATMFAARHSSAGI
jgi:hypothetical protein